MEPKRKFRQKRVGSRRCRASSTSHVGSGFPHKLKRRPIRRLQESKNHVKLSLVRQPFRPHRASRIRGYRRKAGNWLITSRNEGNVTAESGIVTASSNLDSSPTYSSLDWDAVSTSSRCETVPFFKPETGKTPEVETETKHISEPGPLLKKYARLKPIFIDVSVSQIDGDDCCIVFDKSVSSVNACSLETATAESVSLNQSSACSSKVDEKEVAKSVSLNQNSSCSFGIVDKAVAESVSSNQSSARASEVDEKATESVSLNPSSACSFDTFSKAMSKSVSSNQSSVCSETVEKGVAKSVSLNPSSACSSDTVNKAVAKSVSSNQSSASSKAMGKTAVAMRGSWVKSSASCTNVDKKGVAKSDSLNPNCACASDVEKAATKTVSSTKSTAFPSNVLKKTVASSDFLNRSSSRSSVIVKKAVANSVSLNQSNASPSSGVEKADAKSVSSTKNSTCSSDATRKAVAKRVSSIQSNAPSSNSAEKTVVKIVSSNQSRASQSCVVEKAVAHSVSSTKSSACSSDTIKKPVAESVSSIQSNSSSDIVKKAAAKSVSSIQSNSSDIVEKIVAKEVKIINDPNTNSNQISGMPPEILSPLMLKLCKNFTARVDDAAVKKQLVKDGVETSDEVPQGKMGEVGKQCKEKNPHLPDEKNVEGVLEGLKENLDENCEQSSESSLHAALANLSDSEAELWDSDTSSVQRELPEEKREKCRKLKHESTLEGDFKRRSGSDIDNLPSKKISLEEYIKKGVSECSLTATGTVSTENSELELTETMVSKDTNITNTGIEKVPITRQDSTIDESTVLVPNAEVLRPATVDAGTNTAMVSPRKRKCHCRMTKFKLRRLNRKMIYMKKLMLRRTRTFKFDRNELSTLLKNHNEVMKSFLTVLRSQVSFNERVLSEQFLGGSRPATSDARSASAQTDLSRLFTPEKQSSSVQTERSRLFTPEKQSSSVQTELSRLTVPKKQSCNVQTERSCFITKENPSSSTQTERPFPTALLKQSSSAGREQARLITIEEQSSDTCAEPGSSAVEVLSLSEKGTVKSCEVLEVPPPEASSTMNSAARQLFREGKAQKRKAKRPLSLKEPGKVSILKSWDAILQKAGRQKELNSSEESREKRDSSREPSNESSDSSVSTDMSVANNFGSSAITSSLEEEAQTVEDLKAALEELIADEEDEEELLKKRKRRIRFKLDEDEIEARQTERAVEQEESLSPQDNKQIRPGRSVKSKPSRESLSSDDDVSWNLYIKDLVGRLSQEYSINESRTAKESPRKREATKIKLHNEDVLSFLFLDEQYVFNTRKIDTNFRRFPYDEADLTKIISELRVNGDVDVAEKAIYQAGILNCSLAANEQTQLRQYLKTFAPSTCFYFQVHLDIQTGVEALRVVLKEARCKDDVIEGLEGLKVSVKGVHGSLPKFVDNETEGEVSKSTVVIGPVSFISQDCSPNVKFTALDRHTVGVVATRDILPGEELFVRADFSCKKKKVNHPRKCKEKEQLDRSF